MVFSRQLEDEEVKDLLLLQEFVRNAHANSDSHDYAHVLTVTKSAIQIAKSIKDEIDPFICIAAAMLHDIGKTTNQFSNIHGLFGGSIAEEFLEGMKIDKIKREKICRAVVRHTPTSMIPPESPVEKVIYDADTLDRLGLMGLIRGFVGKSGSMEHILNKYMERRMNDYDKLHYDISRELGDWMQQELEGFVPFIRKRLTDRLTSIDDLFVKEGLTSKKFVEDNDFRNNH